MISFAVWVVNASGWYVGKLVANNGIDSYATNITLAVPQAGGYTIKVGWRATPGSGAWTLFGSSGGTFTVGSRERAPRRLNPGWAPGREARRPFPLSVASAWA